MNRSVVSSLRRKYGLVMVVCYLLTGCTSWGNVLSGEKGDQNPELEYPMKLEGIEIGVTSKEETRNLLGEPMDLQFSSDGELTRESWAYVQTQTKMNPLQFVLGVGALALPKDTPSHSFAISFTSKGIVEGITLHEVQPTGLAESIHRVGEYDDSPLLYGENNPLSRASQDTGLGGFSVGGE